MKFWACFLLITAAFCSNNTKCLPNYVFERNFATRLTNNNKQMANICSTRYVFVGKKENISRLAADIKMVSQNSMRNECERYWCLYLATDLLGEDAQTTKMYVRGDFYVEEVRRKKLLLNTSTAGVPCYELFKRIAEKYELEHYWMAEETGCIGIWSNDADRAVWDWEYAVCIDGCTENYFSSYALARKFAEKQKMEEPSAEVEIYNIEYE